MDNAGLSSLAGVVVGSESGPPPPYEHPMHPHIYTDSQGRRRWCRILPGRVGRNLDHWRIELRDGGPLDVPLTTVQRTEPCPACHFTGYITRIMEPKQPAVTVKCKRCAGSGRSPKLGQPPKPSGEAIRVLAAPARSAAPAGRRNITGPSRGDWARDRRSSSDW